MPVVGRIVFENGQRVYKEMKPVAVLPKSFEGRSDRVVLDYTRESILKEPTSTPHSKPGPRPRLRVTHTFVTLPLSDSTYSEIAEKLKAAEYYHCFIDPGKPDETIDMSGLAVTRGG